MIKIRGMKFQTKNAFSLSVMDNEYLNDYEEKIELLSCPSGGMSCKEQLSVINNRFLESYGYHRDKNYTGSIESLKSAFDETKDLKESRCTNCAKLFRSTITESLEKIHDELKEMSTGIFKTKKYQASYVMAGNTLRNFKGNQ